MSSLLTRGSAVRVVNAVASLAVAAAIGIQIATGVDDYPTVPPGAVLAVVAAVIVLAVRSRWAVVAGFVYPVWIVIGAFATSGTGDRLSRPSDLGPFLGTVLQVAALAVGLVTGVALVAALVPAARRRAHA